jgi:hypothetical protein
MSAKLMLARLMLCKNTMKTKLLLVGLCVGCVAWASVASEIPSSHVSWIHRTFGELNWSEVVELSKAPRDICRYVNRQVSYRSDFNNETNVPDGKVVFARGYGDCDDIAKSVVALCHEKRFAAEMVILWPKGDIAGLWPKGEIIGHAIVIGNWAGQLWMSSNGKYEIVPSVSHAIKRITLRMGWKNADVQYQGPRSFEVVQTRPPIPADISTSTPGARQPQSPAIDITQRDRYGWTALHNAVNDGNDATVSELLRLGADIHAIENRGWTPLHYAADLGQTTIVRILLAAGADVNAKNTMGWTALHLAAMRGKTAAITVLLESNARTDICTGRGLNAYNLAVANKHDEVGQLLLARIQTSPLTMLASTK